MSRVRDRYHDEMQHLTATSAVRHHESLFFLFFFPVFLSFFSFSFLFFFFFLSFLPWWLVDCIVRYSKSSEPQKQQKNAKKHWKQNQTTSNKTLRRWPFNILWYRSIHQVTLLFLFCLLLFLRFLLFFGSGASHPEIFGALQELPFLVDVIRQLPGLWGGSLLNLTMEIERNYYQSDWENWSLKEGSFRLTNQDFMNHDPKRPNITNSTHIILKPQRVSIVYTNSPMQNQCKTIIHSSLYKHTQTHTTTNLTNSTKLPHPSTCISDLCHAHPLGQPSPHHPSSVVGLVSPHKRRLRRLSPFPAVCSSSNSCSML